MSKVQCSAQNIHDFKKKLKNGWVRVVLVTCVYACSSRAKVCVWVLHGTISISVASQWLNWPSSAVLKITKRESPKRFRGRKKMVKKVTANLVGKSSSQERARQRQQQSWATEPNWPMEWLDIRLPGHVVWLPYARQRWPCRTPVVHPTFVRYTCLMPICLRRRAGGEWDCRRWGKRETIPNATRSPTG